MDPLTIALAIYGGYQGYKSAKKSGANTLGKVFGTALGAYGGYNLGQGIGSLTNAGPAVAENIGQTAVTEGVTKGIGAFNPYAGVIDPYAGTSLGMDTSALQNAAVNQVPLGGVQAYNPELANFGKDAVAGTFQQIQPITSPYAGTSLEMNPATARYGISETDLSKAGNINGAEGGGQKEKSFLDQATEMAKKTFYDEKTGVKLGNVALVGVPAALYASGAFDREPYERSMFTYNANYPDLYRSRKFYTQDPKTGQTIELPQQQYIPEERADVQSGDRFGPYKRETIKLQQGGIATLNHFRDGGINYLPSKTIHDEDNEDNYMRVNGYVEDGANNGDKEEDTMLAQLADGEFVTRTDGVLGAGILAGANPKDQKEMRKLGAEFFYEQQKRFKRIYDLLDASRKATAH
jgi:hypothetical protein